MPRLARSEVRFPALGQLLKSRRLAFGATLEQVAVAIGTSKSYIWELERGRIEPGASNLFRLAQVLEIPLRELKPCFPWTGK